VGTHISAALPAFLLGEAEVGEVLVGALDVADVAVDVVEWDFLGVRLKVVEVLGYYCDLFAMLRLNTRVL
jgi:hypothetical protein